MYESGWPLGSGNLLAEVDPPSLSNRLPTPPPRRGRSSPLSYPPPRPLPPGPLRARRTQPSDGPRASPSPPPPSSPRSAAPGSRPACPGGSITGPLDPGATLVPRECCCGRMGWSLSSDICMHANVCTYTNVHMPTCTHVLIHMSLGVHSFSYYIFLYTRYPCNETSPRACPAPEWNPGGALRGGA